MMKERNIKEKIGNVIVFMGVFFSFFILEVYMKAPKYHYDSILYWFAGDYMIEDGSINFLNYPKTYIYRGYALPFLYKMLRLFATADTLNLFSFRVANALIWSVLCYYLLPSLMQRLFKVRVKKYISILLSGLIIFFWYGSVIHTLSDGYATILIFLDVMLLIMLKEKQTFMSKALCAFFIGVISYLVYNIRTMYIISLYVLFFVLIYYIFKGANKVYSKIAIFSIAIIGFVMAGIPQMIINMQYMNEISIRVPTEAFSGAGNNLFIYQLFAGLELQRYETYIGTDYASPGLQFIDVVGKEILQGVQGKEYTLIELIKIYLKHPIDCIGIYMRHFINALDNRFPEVYIQDLNKNRSLYIVLNYSIIYVFFYSLWQNLNKIRKERKGKEMLDIVPLLAVILLPSLLATAGALEIRFYMPVWFLIYAYVLYVTEYRQMLSNIRKNILISAIIYFGGFAIVVSIWSACMGTLVGKVIL